MNGTEAHLVYTVLGPLRQNVTSKGGATAEAVRVFDEAHLDNTLQKGMQACAARAREMGQLFI